MIGQVYGKVKAPRQECQARFGKGLAVSLSAALSVSDFQKKNHGPLIAIADLSEFVN
jgi:hypothetical protein